MAEYKTEAQVNYGWGLSLNMTGKAPAVAKRIFETKADALAYVNDVNDSAIAGIAIGVINDPEEANNGLYFVKKIGTGSDDGEMAMAGAEPEALTEAEIDALLS